MQPAPLPVVHYQTMKNVGNSADTTSKTNVQIAEKEKPVAMNSSGKKRKSGGTFSSDTPDKDSGSGTAKKPRTSRPKKSDEGATKSSTKKAQAETLLDVSSINLDGEETESVPVYETCDTIRRKVRDILKKDGVTQAGFCRSLAQVTNKPPQPTQLTRFMNSHGPLGGNTNIVFYASYVLFEKMRIRDGKPKSKFRQEVEEVHGEKGVDIEHNMNTQYITLHVTETMSFGKYEKLRITGGHSPDPSAM